MYPPPLAQWKRMTAKREERDICPLLKKSCSNATRSHIQLVFPAFSLSFLLEMQPPPAVTVSIATSSRRSPPPLAVSAASCIPPLLRSTNSSALELPDLNNGLEHVTWQNRGGTRANQFQLRCAVKWRRPTCLTTPLPTSSLLLFKSHRFRHVTANNEIIFRLRLR